MKIQLINTPYLETYGSLKRIAAVYFPLGLGYIASILRENGFYEIDLFDPEAEKSNWEDIKARITSFGAQIIGLSCVTATYPAAKKIAKLVKSINRKTLVVIGGVHASALPKETVKDCPQVDLVVVGEGEYPFLEICQKLEKKGNFNDIPGVVFRQKSKIFSTPKREFILGLDKIPFPARYLVNLDNYKTPPHMDTGEKSVTLISSRGCPAQCTFCASHVVAGRRFRPHSPEYVVREIDYLQAKYGYGYFIFEDDSFTIDKERVKKISQLLIKRKKKITWSCFGRVNTVDRSTLKLMKKAGCHLIGYGIESGDQEIRRNIKKGITEEQCKKAFELSKKAGLKTQGFFMIGNPGETEKTIEKTINFAIELDPTLAFFSPLVPYPGTEIYNNLCGVHFDPSRDWADYSAFGDRLALRLHHIPSEKLKYYCFLANRKFYWRPLYILKRLRNLSSFAELKASFLGASVLFSKKFLKQLTKK